MGAGNFLTYLLGGVADSAENLRKKNEAQAQLDQEEQKSVYKILLQSPDPKIQSLGLTGLLEPPKKSPFGNLKKSPTYMQALDLVHRGQTGQPAPPDAATTPPNPEVAAPTPPPPVPMSGAMPNVPPMTGGGGKTGPAPAAPALSAPPAPTAGPPAPPPMPPPPLAAAAVQQGPHPEKVVHDFLSGFRSPQEAMQWVESQERGQIFAKPELHPLKVALTNAIGSGGTMEDVKDQLLPTRAKMQSAEQIAQARVAAMLAKPRPGKIVYDTVGNRKVAKLVDSATGALIKPDLSEQEIAMGHAITTDNTGNQTLVQFSNVPNSGKATGTTPPPAAPGSSSTAKPGVTPPPSAPAGISLGNKNKLPSQELGQLTQAEGAYKLFDEVKKSIEDAGMTDAKDLGDSLQRRWESAKYTHGIGQDEFNHDLQQKLSAADLKMISTFTSAGRMSSGVFDKIKQHLTRPDVVPPGVIYDDIKNLQSMIREFGTTTYRNAKVVPPTGSMFGSAASATSAAIPPGFVLQENDKTGAKRYYNVTTGESRPVTAP